MVRRMDPIDKAYLRVEVNSERQFKILQILLSLESGVIITAAAGFLYFNRIFNAIFCALVLIAIILVKMYMLLLREQFQKAGRARGLSRLKEKKRITAQEGG